MEVAQTLFCSLAVTFTHRPGGLRVRNIAAVTLIHSKPTFIWYFYFKAMFSTCLHHLTEIKIYKQYDPG
jgi:hypothetical protein